MKNAFGNSLEDNDSYFADVTQSLNSHPHVPWSRLKLDDFIFHPKNQEFSETETLVKVCQAAAWLTNNAQISFSVGFEEFYWCHKVGHHILIH